MIDHGRAVCTARRPRHTECVLEDICPKLEPPADRTAVRERPDRAAPRGQDAALKRRIP
jgi:adenine-specific DNA glycosylase